MNNADLIGRFMMCPLCKRDSVEIIVHRRKPTGDVGIAVLDDHSMGIPTGAHETLEDSEAGRAKGMVICRVHCPASGQHVTIRCFGDHPPPVCGDPQCSRTEDPPDAAFPADKTEAARQTSRSWDDLMIAGFSQIDDVDTSTRFCPCGASVTWTGADPKIDAWMADHGRHRREVKPRPDGTYLNVPAAERDGWIQIMIAGNAPIDWRAAYACDSCGRVTIALEGAPPTLMCRAPKCGGVGRCVGREVPRAATKGDVR